MIEITKGKVLKDDVVEVSFTKTSSTTKPAKCNEEHKDPPHPDLKRALQNLAIHAALIGEFIPTSEIGDIEKPEHENLSLFHVSSFSTKGDDGEDSVVITAQKTLKTGKVLGFNTPSTRLNDDSDSAYLFAEDLKSCIEYAKAEFREYLNGKIATDPQGKLNFDEPVTNMQVAPEAEEEFNADNLEKPSVAKTKKKNKKKTAEAEEA